jgi:hypothetical protein
MIGKSKHHLSGVNESYFHHQRFAFKYGLTCIQAGLMAMVHGLIPAFFETAASDKVKALAALSRKSSD